ncbi:hypothetical protein [Saccharopolyspora sp. NPDC002376]
MNLPTSISRLAPDDEWLTTVTALLREVANDGFTFHLCGTPEPIVLVASYYWDSYVDLLKITGPDQVTAARAVRGENFNVFQPPAVVWAFGNDAEPTLRALLDLDHPDHPNQPDQPFPTPRVLVTADDMQCSVRLKPPEPSKVGRRERRLLLPLTKTTARDSSRTGPDVNENVQRTLLQPSQTE